MNARRLVDDVTAQAIDLRWFRDALAPASPYGVRLYERIEAFVPGEEALAQAHAQRIAAIAAACGEQRLDAMREIFHNVADAGNAIARASMGDLLSDANLLELQRFFDACMRLDGLAAGVVELPAAVDDAVRSCARELELGRAGKFGFYLSDAFDEPLARARATLASAQAEYDAVTGRASAKLGAQLRREISGSEFIVMRADLDGPLPAGIRVVREAPTYLLCEIDADEAMIAALERRDALAGAVAAAEEAVRARLTAIIQKYAAALDAAAVRFGEVDVIVAAARFTLAHRCVPATIVDEPKLAFADGRFVPLALELEKEGRAFAPISVALHDVCVLTGPNMGGKSVCLRTCGQIALLAAYGIPVPASSATSGLFEEISWLGVGSEVQGGLLSSFAREVVRLRDVLERGRARLFVLMDEFARTTTPLEGRALLVAVLRRFAALRACGLSATHLAAVAGAAGVRHFAVRGLRGIPEKPKTSDLTAALETLAASMDYTIEEVTADSPSRSDAIALAALLGLDEAVIEEAYATLE